MEGRQWLENRRGNSVENVPGKSPRKIDHAGSGKHGRKKREKPRWEMLPIFRGKRPVKNVLEYGAENVP
jgi:hypothetical protein